jgi:hypothetical protein
MSNPWSINIDSWIFSDGNYASFFVGETRHFAVEFSPLSLARSSSNEKSASLIEPCVYRINGQVSYIDERTELVNMFETNFFRV